MPRACWQVRLRRSPTPRARSPEEQRVGVGGWAKMYCRRPGDCKSSQRRRAIRAAKSEGKIPQADPCLRFHWCKRKCRRPVRMQSQAGVHIGEQARQVCRQARKESCRCSPTWHWRSTAARILSREASRFSWAKTLASLRSLPGSKIGSKTRTRNP